MTEDQFWRSTPKKLQALFNVYKKVNGIEEEEELEYIELFYNSKRLHLTLGCKFLNISTVLSHSYAVR